MICGGDKQAGRWPVVYFLQKDSDKAFELTYIRRVVTTFCNGVKLVEQQNSIHSLRVIQNMTDVGARAT